METEKEISTKALSVILGIDSFNETVDYNQKNYKLEQKIVKPRGYHKNPMVYYLKSLENIPAGKIVSEINCKVSYVVEELKYFNFYELYEEHLRFEFGEDCLLFSATPHCKPNCTVVIKKSEHAPEKEQIYNEVKFRGYRIYLKSLRQIKIGENIYLKCGLYSKNGVISCGCQNKNLCYFVKKEFQENNF